MINKTATRFFSNRQESYISKLLDGQKSPNSGASHFAAGDVLLDDWLIECKTCMKPKNSFTIKKEWITKNERERLDLQKPFSGLVFQFEPDGENYFVIKESLFKDMLKAFKED